MAEMPDLKGRWHVPRIFRLIERNMVIFVYKPIIEGSAKVFMAVEEITLCFHVVLRCVYAITFMECQWYSSS